jgi:hypothetical protein
VPLTPIAGMGAGLPSLGLYPTVQGLATQLLTLFLVLLPVWLERKRAQSPKLA